MKQFAHFMCTFMAVVLIACIPTEPAEAATTVISGSINCRDDANWPAGCRALADIKKFAAKHALQSKNCKFGFTEDNLNCELEPGETVRVHVNQLFMGECRKAIWHAYATVIDVPPYDDVVFTGWSLGGSPPTPYCYAYHKTDYWCTPQ